MAKFKLKTVKGAAKRFKKTKGGLKFRQGHRNHILTKKPTKRLRHLRSNRLVNKVEEPALRRMLPYA